MSNTCHLFGPLYSCSVAVDIDGASGSNPAMGRSPCSVVRPITPKRVSGGPKRRVLMTKTKTEKNMNNTNRLKYAQLWRVYDSQEQAYLVNPKHRFYDNGVEVDPSEYPFTSRSEALKEAKKQYGIRSIPSLYFQSEGWYQDMEEVE